MTKKHVRGSRKAAPAKTAPAKGINTAAEIWLSAKELLRNGQVTAAMELATFSLLGKSSDELERALITHNNQFLSKEEIRASAKAMTRTEVNRILDAVTNKYGPILAEMLTDELNSKGDTLDLGDLVGDEEEGMESDDSAFDEAEYYLNEGMGEDAEETDVYNEDDLDSEDDAEAEEDNEDLSDVGDDDEDGNSEVEDEEGDELIDEEAMCGPKGKKTVKASEDTAAHATYRRLLISGTKENLRKAAALAKHLK